MRFCFVSIVKREAYIVIQFLIKFFLKKPKIAKNNKKTQKYVFDIFASFVASFPKNLK
jgi:hypothetical protein